LTPARCAFGMMRAEDAIGILSFVHLLRDKACHLVSRCHRMRLSPVKSFRIEFGPFSFAARSLAGGRQTPPSAAPGKSGSRNGSAYHTVPRQLRRLGAGGVAGIGAGVSPVRTSCRRRMRKKPTTGNRCRMWCSAEIKWSGSQLRGRYLVDRWLKRSASWRCSLCIRGMVQPDL
jgi:hypothetical protein